MVQLILILTFAALHLHDDLSGPRQQPAPWVWWLVLAPCVASALGFQLLAWRAGRRIDRTGSLAAAWGAERAMLVARLLSGAACAAATLAGGWPDAVRALTGDLVLLDELLAASPVLLVILSTWWSIYPIDRRLKEAALWRRLHEGSPLHAPPTRAEFVLSQARVQVLMILLPVSLLSAWGEALARVPRWAGWARALPGWWHWAHPLFSWGGVLLVLVVTPALLKAAWDTQPLASGPLAQLARAMCRDYRVRVRGPLVWRTHGSILNGAILGLAWPFRYMLFTDALLERLDQRQIEGVMAHEVAHVRERHMLWLGVLAVGAVLCLAWAAELAAHAFSLPVDSSLGVSVMAGATLLGAGLLFGVASRRFEWQADAFAVKHLSAKAAESSADLGVGVRAEAAAGMASTLQAVADLNGIRTDRFTFRHGSIDERLRRIRALAGLPLDALPIDRQAARLKALAGALLVAGVSASIAGLVLAAP